MVSAATHALPRIVVAAPASGHGKTTIATGLMAALRHAGHRVSGHKIGPDYIDPGYHALATGLPGRNLDPHLVSEDRVAPLLIHGAASADVAVIEGVMGLFDGQVGTDGFASTAHVATLSASPIVLVVDISHASRSIAAIVHGMGQFDAGVHIGGVILNKAGSQRHADEVTRALEPSGIPVLGVLFRDHAVAAPSRTLGLMPASRRDDATDALDRLTAAVVQSIDLSGVMRIAQSAPALHAARWQPGISPPTCARPVVAVAGGRAFSFRYTETLELLAAAGVETIEFDPASDESLPDGTCGIYFGGGFPEAHVAELAANRALHERLRAPINAGMPVVSEGAGTLYLGRSMDGEPMVGVLDTSASMTSQLTLSYGKLQAPGDNVLAAAGTVVTGHEFHRATMDPAGDNGWITETGATGFGSPSLHASLVHTHWAGYPQLAERFAGAVHNYAHANTSSSTVSVLDPLRFHGDAEPGDGLVDFAVNTDDSGPPPWLVDALHSSVHDAQRYPHDGGAQEALAHVHGRDLDDVLPTAGAAEAFTLIARCQQWKLPVVIHPQFTEADAALQAAGYRPEHVITTPEQGFTLDPNRVPDDADLVFIGNPTNPTGIAHRRGVIEQLVRPGRLVVIDEAFMDAIPKEEYSWTNQRRSGIAVLRSLTKTWAIPGVRAGYVLADEQTITLLRRQQPPWSVSSQAAAAMIACTTPQASDEARKRAYCRAQRRDFLVAGLAELAIPIGGAPVAPFVLAHIGLGGHARLRAAGYAVRRADTFPGLDESWVRIAARTPDITTKLLAVLRSEGAPWI